MKLRYYADAPDYDDHERIIDLLFTIHDKYGITVEVERVEPRYGEIQVFPGDIHRNDPEQVYDRDFHYNRTLGANVGESPSTAFKASGRHVDIDGIVGVVDDGLVWATTHRGDPIGAGPDVEQETTTLGFLDAVADRGLAPIEAKYMDPEQRDRAVLDDFLEAGMLDGTIHRDVTVGTSLLPDHPTGEPLDAVTGQITRTVEAIVKAEDVWVLHSAKTLDASTLDTAIGHVLVRDRLYRADEGLAPEATTPAIVFGTAPWELDEDGVPEALDWITTGEATPVTIFAGRPGNVRRVTG